MRIALVSHAGLGGSGRVAAHLGQALAEGGDDVHLLSTAEPASLPSGHRMHVHVVEPPGHPVLSHEPVTMAMAGQIVELSRRHGLDLVHVHFAVPWAVAAWMAAEVLGADGPAVVVTLHGSDVYELGPHPLYREVTLAALRRAHVVTAVSRALRDAARSELGTCVPIEVVPNFIDPANHASSTTARPAPPVLAHVSNFRAVKRPLDVVEIFARVRAHRAARLRLIGDGPELERTKKRAEELGVVEHIELRGPVDEAARVLEDVRVLLAPSQRESFGLAPLEAQASGVPVVGSAVDGLPEVVAHGQTGWLHPVGDVEAMARSVLHLLDDEHAHANMAAAARGRAFEMFAREPIIRRYRAAYARARYARKRLTSSAA